MLVPVVPRELDAGDAVEGSGLWIIAACTWCSALPLSGLMLKPYIGAMIIVAFTLGALARLQGWLRLHRGPLHRHDSTGFELFVRGVTFLELAFMLTLVVLWFGPWSVHITVWWLVAAVGIVIGAVDIAAPSIAASILGRQVEDPMLVSVGIVSAIAGLVSCVTSLAGLFVSFGLQARATPPSGAETMVFNGLLAGTLLFTAIAAHFGRVAILGIQSVLLERFIDDQSDHEEGARIGGAWIPARTGRRRTPPPDAVESDPIPLSPRKPPRRRRGRSEGR
ncbi:MAG: hypothetical protein CMJ34_11605 [Phycisphaerae bacterium]|nr:hypothetical protein [Phycisphaerae bacterium]